MADPVSGSRPEQSALRLARSIIDRLDNPVAGESMPSGTEGLLARALLLVSETALHPGSMLTAIGAERHLERDDKPRSRVAELTAKCEGLSWDQAGPQYQALAEFLERELTTIPSAVRHGPDPLDAELADIILRHTAGIGDSARYGASIFLYGNQWWRIAEALKASVPSAIRNGSGE